MPLSNTISLNITSTEFSWGGQCNAHLSLTMYPQAQRTKNRKTWAGREQQPHSSHSIILFFLRRCKELEFPLFSTSLRIGRESHNKMEGKRGSPQLYTYKNTELLSYASMLWLRWAERELLFSLTQPRTFAWSHATNSETPNPKNVPDSKLKDLIIAVQTHSIACSVGVLLARGKSDYLL